ncbi:MAG: cob(I)yrinic acid a,c-diamide adenosyltransferase [Flavobacteriales bacterium]|nr:cob(I)yrinic acid a,c-diamide adenosyltransferase [Flavobacteriales bacterium]
MKIYTKKGDTGETSLLGGSRVKKYDMRIEAYGTVDELNSYLGLLRDFGNENRKAEIKTIQDNLFTMGSHLALEPGKTNIKLPQINESDVKALEDSIDEMDATLPPLKNFILPGGHPSVSHAHVARCICRRAERRCTELNEHYTYDPIIVSYLNRLSDYLFTLARMFASEYGVEETPWTPRSSG